MRLSLTSAAADDAASAWRHRRQQPTIISPSALLAVARGDDQAGVTSIHHYNTTYHPTHLSSFSCCNCPPSISDDDRRWEHIAHHGYSVALSVVAHTPLLGLVVGKCVTSWPAKMLWICCRLSIGSRSVVNYNKSKQVEIRRMTVT